MNEDVKAFKNELRNYRFYVSRIVFLNGSIEFLYDRLGGVRGIDPSKEPTHSLPNKDMEYKIRDDISRLEAKKLLTERKVEEIEEILGKIDIPIRDAIRNIYIDGMHTTKVADMMFLSSSGLHGRINRAIKKALL